MIQLPEVPESNHESVDRFWQALIKAGKEVLAEAGKLGYGYSLIEIKYREGNPAVLIRSHTQTLKYRTTQDAMIAINEILTKTTQQGSQTFTVVREEGGLITRVQLDEYLSDRLM